MRPWLLLWLTAFLLLHPIPAVPMFDTVYLAETLRERTLPEAMRFMAGYHSSPRPVRTLELWSAARLWGTSAWGYGLANMAGALGICLAVASIAQTITGSRRRGIAAAWLMACCYPMLYALLHYPFGLNIALGLLGLAAVLRAHGWLGYPLMLAAALGHEIVLALMVVGLLHRLVHRPTERWATTPSAS